MATSISAQNSQLGLQLVDPLLQPEHDAHL